MFFAVTFTSPPPKLTALMPLAGPPLVPAGPSPLVEMVPRAVMVIAPSVPLPSVTASIAPALSPSVLTLPAVISIAPAPSPLRPLSTRMPREPVPVVVTEPNVFGRAPTEVSMVTLPLAPAPVVMT